MPDGQTERGAYFTLGETDARREETDALRPALTERAFDYLLAAGPWMNFLGVVSFVVCGLMLIGGVIIMFAGDALDLIPGDAAVGLLYIASSALCFFPARFIFLAGSRLRSLKAGGGADALEAALRNNKAYWKFSGLLTIAGLSLAILLVIIAVVAFAVSGA